MMLRRTALCVALLAVTASPSPAKIRSEKDRMRAEAEHACYNDAKSLCSHVMPDEAKVTACMKAKHARLSAGCRAIFDRGSGM